MYLLDLISELTTEQLNKIPESFNNNIIWNLAHMIAAQQGICYKRTGVPIVVTEAFFDSYKPGTKPVGFVDADGIAVIKAQLIATINQFEADLENKELFANYTTVMTRYGVELTSIEDAVSFLPFHDGFHMGYVLALKRLV